MKLLKPLYIIVTLWVFIFSSCEDSIAPSDPSSTEEWIEIAFDGEISDRNDGSVASKSVDSEIQSKSAINLYIGYNSESTIRTKADNMSYSARYLFFDTTGKCLLCSEKFTVTPTNNKFRVPAKIPEGKSGKIYLFLSIADTDLSGLATVTAESDLTKIWTSYNSLTTSDNIPLSGYITYTSGQKNVPVTVSHTGTKLSFNYTVQSYADFQPEQIVIGNVLGRNYLVNSNIENTSNTTNLNSYTIQSNNPKGTLTCYIPENIQLTNNSIQNPWDKTFKNAPARATYIEIKGRCISKNLPAKLRIYPGANGTSDFNLKRNGSYVINLDMYFLDPEDPRITIGEELPVLIFDVTNMPQTITSFTYTGSPTPVIQNKRVIITESSNRIGQKISEIKINGKKGKTFYTSILIQSGINYYTLDWNYNGTGSGTEDDPYLVADKNNLDDISNNLSSHFLQVDNIMYNNYFTAIGSESNPFTGTYNGNSKNISMLSFINVKESGLFGYTQNASLKNINAEVFIRDSGLPSAIIGGINMNATQTLIENCKITGAIDISIETQIVGGVVGKATSSKITNNSFEGTLRINNRASRYVGGIVGVALDSEITENNFTKFKKFEYKSENIVGAIMGAHRNSSLSQNMYNSKYKEFGAILD